MIIHSLLNRLRSKQVCYRIIIAKKLQKSGVKKLVSIIDDKGKYVLHYRNLQLYLQLGLKLKKIHRVLN